MSGYACESCEGKQPVVLLLTNLENGQTDCACASDIPIMLTGNLAVWAGVDPAGLYDAIKRHIDKEARKQDAAAAAELEAAAGAAAGDPPREDGTAGDGQEPDAITQPEGSQTFEDLEPEP